MDTAASASEWLTSLAVLIPILLSVVVGLWSDFTSPVLVSAPERRHCET
jgi:hypothetical protein